MSPEECIDKLEQLIFDEGELVTYKFLSKELKIHVNEAKKYLFDFLTVQNSKGDVRLYAYYFLVGIIVKDGVQSTKFVVVSEDNLESIKKEFKEVTTCHIYSVHKGRQRDDSSLYSCQSWCNKWAEEHREYSAIKHPNIVIQNPSVRKVDVKKNESKVILSKAPIVKQTKNGSVASAIHDIAKTESSLLTENKISEKDKIDDKKLIVSNNVEGKTSSSTQSNSEPKDKKKSTLSSLWQKLEDKTKNGKNENSKVESKGKKGSVKNVGKNNIMSMFSKQAEKNAVNSVKKTTNDSISPVKATPTPEITENHTSSEAKIEAVDKKIQQQKSKKKTSQRQKKRSSKQVSDNESDEEVKPKKKKHRRICTMDDSDSESESEEARDKARRSLLTLDEPRDVVMPGSDDNEDPIPPTPPVLPVKGKRRVWKTVEKTFEDEEGFLVATKEKVLVSASDSDEDPLTSKKPESKTDMKQNTFMYRKQASLTSFFKQQ